MSDTPEDLLGLEETLRAQSDSRLVYRRAWNDDVWHWRWDCRHFPMWQYQSSLGEPSTGLICSRCAAIADANLHDE